MFGEYPFATSMLFLFISVVLLAQVGITLYTYQKEGRTKDLNYYWSALVMIFSIFAVILSLVAVAGARESAQAMFAAAPAGAPAAAPAAGVGGLVQQLQAASGASAAQAANLQAVANQQRQAAKALGALQGATAAASA